MTFNEAMLTAFYHLHQHQAAYRSPSPANRILKGDAACWPICSVNSCPITRSHYYATRKGVADYLRGF